MQTYLNTLLIVFFPPQVICIFWIIPPQTVGIGSLLCMLCGTFFPWESGVLYLSSGVAPLLHPALPQCIFFSSDLKAKTWRARLKLNKTPAGLNALNLTGQNNEKQRDIDTQSIQKQTIERKCEDL